MTIHREGKYVILYLLLIFSVAAFAFYMLFPGLLKWWYLFCSVEVILLFFVITFFRSPKRIIPIEKSKILSPADGKIVVVEKMIPKEYLQGSYIQISIFMSIWNVHLNRIPCGGVVKYIQYHPGSFFIAKHPKASLLNEMNTTVIETERKEYVMIRQIAGAVARRIATYVNEGDSVEQGEELGFIRFGSRVDIMVPESYKILVKPGMHVKAGVDIIAEW